MTVVASAVAVTETGSVSSAELSAIPLAVVVAGVSLEAVRAASGNTVSERGFLLGGSTSLRRPRFRLGCWEGSMSSTTGLLLFEEPSSSGMYSLHSLKCAMLLVSASNSSRNGSMSPFGLLAQKTILLSR